tara:strand:- start:221 stop:535 length:315 start_codon:yes stop_codon:yes gene_type:complete
MNSSIYDHHSVNNFKHIQKNALKKKAKYMVHPKIKMTLQCDACGGKIEHYLVHTDVEMGILNFFGKQPCLAEINKQVAKMGDEPQDDDDDDEGILGMGPAAPGE